MEDGIAMILNESLLTGSMEEGLRLVCEDYFTSNTDGNSESDSDNEDVSKNIIDEEQSGAGPSTSGVQELDLANILFLEDVNDDELIASICHENIEVEEVQNLEQEVEVKQRIGEDDEEADISIWEPVLQNEIAVELDAEIWTMYVDGCCKRKCYEGIIEFGS